MIPQSQDELDLFHFFAEVIETVCIRREYEINCWRSVHVSHFSYKRRIAAQIQIRNWSFNFTFGMLVNYYYVFDLVTYVRLSSYRYSIRYS